MKKYSFVLILIMSLGQVFSQKKPKKKDSIVEVINVITSYTPTISDAFKIKKTPKIILSNTTSKKKLSYSIFSAPVASTFVPKSGVVKGIDVGKKERLFDNYLALGFGNYTTPFIEFFLHQNRKFETDYGIYLKYTSSENGVKNTFLNNEFSTLNLGGFYLKEERGFTWKIGGNMYQKQYNWYGLPNISFDNNTINSIAAEQTYGFYEVESEVVFENSYFDNIKGALSLFDDKFGSKEVGFLLKPSLKIPLGFISKSLSELELQTNINYLQGEFEQNYLNNSNIKYSFFNLGIHPVYRVNWNKLSIKLGSKIYLTSDIENSLTDILAYPDLEITYPVIPNLINFYAGAGGDLNMNSFQKFSEQNPFVSPTLFLTQTNESNGVFNASTSLLGYEYGNSFNVFYDDISTLSIFGEIEIDASKRFSIGATIQTNSYSTTFQQEAWNLPKIEGAIYGKYKNNNWYANANIFFVGSRMDVQYNGTFPSTIASIESLDAFTDMNLNGGYHFSDFFSAFIKLNNILGTDYDRYANYNVLGFQVLAGITYKFDF